MCRTFRSINKQKLTSLAGYLMVQKKRGWVAEKKADQNRDRLIKMLVRGRYEALSKLVEKEKIKLSKFFPAVLLACLSQDPGIMKKTWKAERELAEWWIQRKDFYPSITEDLDPTEGNLVSRNYATVFEHPAFQGREMGCLVVDRYFLKHHIYSQILHSQAPKEVMEEIWQAATVHPRRKKELPALVALGRLFLHNTKHVNDKTHRDTIEKREWSAGLGARMEAEMLRQKVEINNAPRRGGSHTRQALKL